MQTANNVAEFAMNMWTAEVTVLICGLFLILRYCSVLCKYAGLLVQTVSAARA